MAFPRSGKGQREWVSTKERKETVKETGARLGIKKERMPEGSHKACLLSESKGVSILKMGHKLNHGSNSQVLAFADDHFWR
jgi:hypothetical protein